MFMADLVRAMSERVTMDFMAVSSYGKGTTSSGQVRVLKDLDSNLEGRHVIVVEDIVDTGLTLHYLQDLLKARAPKSMKTACLLSKPSRRKVDVQVDYIGFTIEDHFVVGYGLDYAEKYRNLPYIAILRAVTTSKRGSRSTARFDVTGFDIITEADARQIERGATVELSKGGHVTPLAQDTLRERRVTVVPAGSVDRGAAGGPGAEVRDPAGRDCQRSHRREDARRDRPAPARSRGSRSTTWAWTARRRSTIRTPPARVAKQVARGEADAGIVIDGAGIGSAIAANKVRGIRAAMITDETIARYAREHNGTNVMTLGSTLLPDAGRPSAWSTSGSARR